MCILVSVWPADEVQSKAAHCLFDESLIRSMLDLEKMTERGRQTKIKLNVDPRLYGTCCFNRFEPVRLCQSAPFVITIMRAFL